MQLKLTTRTVNGILVVNCDGRIVFGEESAELRDSVKKLLTQTNKLVLNLGRNDQTVESDAARRRFAPGHQVADNLRSVRYRRSSDPVSANGRGRVSTF